MSQGLHKFVTSDCCVEMETVVLILPVIVALPAILSFEILASKGNRLSMNFSDRGLSFKGYFFVIFYRHCENWILTQNF